MENTTYILFGSTNGYQAQGSGLFRGRTLIATDVLYGTAQEASAKLMAYSADESDELIKEGDMAYHHDGYSWSFEAINDLSEAEAKAALAYGIGSDDEQVIYSMHPDLAPQGEE